MVEDYKKIWQIRNTIPDTFDYFYEQIMNLAIGIMSLRADKLCAQYNKRIGVFGPYPKKGKEIILNIARKISECNYGAMTGMGFYAQNCPDKLHNLDELMLPMALKALKAFDVPDYIKFRHFPKLVCKAVHHLSAVRGQRNEAEGCFSIGIPMMGFIMDRQVSRTPKNYCQYLVNYGVYFECMCPSEKFCFYPTMKVFCPFYDYVDIPWDVKQLFINEKNRLVAVSNMKSVYYVIEECIKAKPFKRKTQYDLQ